MIKVGDIFYSSGFYIIEKIEPQVVDEINKYHWNNQHKKLGEESLPLVTYRQIATKSGMKRTSKKVFIHPMHPENTVLPSAQDAINRIIGKYQHILDRIK